MEEREGTMLIRRSRTSNDNCILEAGSIHRYTYKFRGVGLGCQPKGFLDWQNIAGYKYEVITYDRELTEEEISEYELLKIIRNKPAY